MEFFDLNKLFNWSRLVEPIPSGDWQFIWWAIGISVGLIVLAIVRTFWPGDLVLKHKTEAWLWTLGICSLILTFSAISVVRLYEAARTYFISNV